MPACPPPHKQTTYFASKAYYPQPHTLLSCSKALPSAHPPTHLLRLLIRSARPAVDRDLLADLHTQPADARREGTAVQHRTQPRRQRAHLLGGIDAACLHVVHEGVGLVHDLILKQLGEGGVKQVGGRFRNQQSRDTYSGAGTTVSWAPG